MKKIFALALVVALCLSLVACGGEIKKAEKAIVGEWKTLNGDVTTFKDDGTGTAPYGGTFSWKYNKETEWYMMSLEGMTFSCEIKNEDGLRFISIEGEKYYHADDYEKAAANK